MTNTNLVGEPIAPAPLIRQSAGLVVTGWRCPRQLWELNRLLYKKLPQESQETNPHLPGGESVYPSESFRAGLYICGSGGCEP